jgi:arylsulfatase A-like enzyme
LGDIVQHVKNLGLGENTLILFMGDNGSDAPLPTVDGYSSSSPLKGKKGNHWEGGMRVPFIASWVTPSKKTFWQEKLPIAGNSVQQQQGTVLDVFPTLCEILKIPFPEHHIIDGYNLRDQFNGQKNLTRNELFLNHFPHGKHRSNYFTSLVKSNWKVIYHYPIEGQPRYELFNLKKDPFEKNNVATKNSGQLKIMMKALVLEMDDKKALYPEKGGRPLKLAMPIE